MYRETNNLANFLVLIMIVPVVLLTWDVKLISYDNEHVFISNGRIKKTYELKDLKRVKEPNNFFDPYFKIELVGKDGTTDQFRFLARADEQLRYSLSGRLTGRILELKNIKEQQSFDQV